MRWLALLTSFFPLFAALGCGLLDRADTLIVARAGDLESIDIAEAWAEARGIPEDRILRLRLTSDPGRLMIEAQTYLTEIAAPIETFLALEDPDHEIRYLVTAPGLPLQIGECDIHTAYYPTDCNSAAVDAALAQLGRTGDSTRAFTRGPNPYFRDPRPFEEFARAEPDSGLRFLVARLPHRLPATKPSATDEAPEPSRRATWQVVPGLGSDESTSLATSVLFASLAPQLVPYGHVIAGAAGTPRAAGTSRAAGISRAAGTSGATGGSAPLPDGDAPSVKPMGVISVASAKRAVDPEGPGPGIDLDFPGIVIELGGTTTGDKRSAETLDRLESRITGWIERGAHALSMHLGDPTLAGVSRPTTYLASLARGRNALEAHFASAPLIGWRNIFVGDPLVQLPETILEAATSAIDANDLDHDGVPDETDNCKRDANTDQLDSDGDGFGNRCDPDVNNDGLVTTSWGAIYPIDERGDLEAIALTARNGPYDPLHDLNGDDLVDERDLIIAQLWLFGRPGP